jgi:oligopeptide/dipeptide ABC transporter ATP-binding protein
MQNSSHNVLEINDLRTFFFTGAGVVRAVDGVSLTIPTKGTLGLVGESGSGKSVTALSILRLVPRPAGKIVSGAILFKGKDLITASEKEMRRVRGNKISMIFQEPMTSLNPVFTIGEQVAETLRLHRGLSRGEAWEGAVSLLEGVHIPDAARRARQYPHEMSGGMRQRVMIAIALSCGPELVIADEPTTALDVTVQAQILELMGELRHNSGASFLIISHNLGVIADIADEVAVMYGGMIVEAAPVKELFGSPLHPYTHGLLKSIPRLPHAGSRMGGDLPTIGGNVPDPVNYPAGCRFHPRCPQSTAECKKEVPPLINAGAYFALRRQSFGASATEVATKAEAHTGHLVRCINWEKLSA